MLPPLFFMNIHTVTMINPITLTVHGHNKDTGPNMLYEDFGPPRLHYEGDLLITV